MSRVAIRNLVLVLVLLIILVVLFFSLRPSSTQQTTSSSTTAESTSPEPQQNNFNLAIRGGTMTPNEITVSEGDHVNFQITSDSPVEFHLHGYDLDEEVEPGEPAELAFDATITGRFDIEDHDTDTELGVLLVQPS
jgi:heme/copper-type cytochrome/quinol oxidase subunit 2